jgi:hypothetical protein
MAEAGNLSQGKEDVAGVQAPIVAVGTLVRIGGQGSRL